VTACQFKNKKMAQQLFIHSKIDDTDEHPYYEFFKDSIGEGSGQYYRGIGEIYRTSSRYQKGYGLLGTSYYRKHGDGFGNILSSLWRVAFPMIKTGAKKLGSAALDVATNVAADALQGKDIREAAKEHLTNKGVELIKQIQKPDDTSIKDVTKTIPAVSPITTSQSTPSFRKLPRKRTGKVTFAQPRSSKQAKYPALKYL
jgi:hypothetical protein